MKPTLLLLFLLLAATTPTRSGGAPPPSGSGTEARLDLRVENVRSPRGTLWVGIYESEEDFLDRHKARLVYQRVLRTGGSHVGIDKLVVGKRYAIAVFHDENDNGELDTNFLGLPTEPWAFSRPLRSWFRLPRFEEMSFVFRPEEGTRTLRLK